MPFDDPIGCLYRTDEVDMNSLVMRNMRCEFKTGGRNYQDSVRSGVLHREAGFSKANSWWPFLEQAFI